MATSSRPAEGTFALYNSQLQQLFARPLPKSGADPSRISTGVNRQTLREILHAGLDDVVRFGKDYRRFTRADGGGVTAHFADGGGVTAHFADGTTATGDLLVGADGTSSMVRSQLIPDAGFDDLGRAIYGKTPLTDQSPGWLPPVFLNGMPRIAGDTGISMGVAAYRKREPFADATARLAPGVALTDTPDYLRWTLSSRNSGLPSTGRRFWGAHEAALHRVALDIVAGWHPTARRIIEEAEVTATFPVGIFCAQPVPRWDAPGVTLLGDAIHTMTPGRGEGANTALRDAALLRARLTEAAALGRSIADAKNDYEQEMLCYGFEAAANSKEPYFARAMTARHGSAGPPPGTGHPGRDDS